MSAADDVIRHTRRWVADVVVGLGLCPFARREVERDSIRYAVSGETSVEGVLTRLVEECLLLDRDSGIETTLLVLPRGFSAFEAYLDLVDLGERLLAARGYEGIYQIASFHPAYVFDDCDEADAANYTNRSPYPVLHLLREASLTRVLERYPDPEGIPTRNIERTRRLGADRMRELLAGCHADTSPENGYRY